MQAGNLNRRVQIQQQAATQDAFGQPQQTWTTIATVWAIIDIQRGALLYETSEFISQVVYRITMRYSRSLVLKPNMRLVYVDAASSVTHTYEIQALWDDNAAHRQISALAYEIDGVA